MVDKASGKTVIGIQAPTDKTLVSWLKQHQSYEVLLPAGKPGKGTAYIYMIKINEPQLPWLRTVIYHTGLDVKMEVTQCASTL